MAGFMASDRRGEEIYDCPGREGRKSPLIRDAGRTEVRWLREQLYPLTRPDRAHWLLWVAPPSQTRRSLVLHHMVERLRWCQENIHRHKLICALASAWSKVLFGVELGASPEVQQFSKGILAWYSSL